MIAVIDTGYLIERQVVEQKITKGYVPESVMNELRTASSREYLDFLSFMVELRNPKHEYVTRIRKDLEGRTHGLSSTDIDVVALTVELRDEASEAWIGPSSPEQVEVCCLTHDNGIKNILSDYDSYGEPEFFRRTFRTRCYTCFALYRGNMDFCRKCGHPTLTKVSVRETENGEEIFLSKHYKHRPRVLKNSRGVELRSADQREYIQYQRMQNDRKKRQQRMVDKNPLY